MKTLLFYLTMLVFCFAFKQENKSKWPYSKQPGRYSTITNNEYNVKNGVNIEIENTVNEGNVFKQTYNSDENIVWSLDTVAPSMIEKDREIAYKYYGEIPGVVWIEKTIFCDETEVANIHWREYLHDRNKLQDLNKKKSLSLVKINYFNSPQFYFFPVVDVSYEDVLDFCKWRTDIVTSKYNLKHGYDSNSKEYTIFNFRLPTESEWIKFASFGIDTNSYPQIFKDSLLTLKINPANLQFLKSLGSSATKEFLDKFNKDIKKDYVINCLRTNNTMLNLNVPFYIWSNPSNQFGIYNMLGNISEMTLEKGIAKGGSFKDPFKVCNTNKRFFYSQPQSNVGFRCMCELKWLNKV